MAAMDETDELKWTIKRHFLDGNVEGVSRLINEYLFPAFEVAEQLGCASARLLRLLSDERNALFVKLSRGENTEDAIDSFFYFVDFVFHFPNENKVPNF